ncbi:MAG: PfkB family carbohydrate kinase [Turicibacter sp.]
MKTLVLGNAIVDVILNIACLPKTGDDMICDKQLVTIGGCAYNVATVLKHFGVDHQLVVPVGAGTYANLIREELTSHGYELVIEETECDNGYCLCLVEQDGERSFITVPGIEANYQEKWLKNLKMDEIETIYVSGYELDGDNGYVISEWLQHFGEKTIYLAPGPRINEIDQKVMSNLFKLNPILHVNEHEGISFTGGSDALDAAKTLYQMTQNPVYITLGPKGVLVVNAQGHHVVDGVPTTVVNTIGAGDCHVGSLIAFKKLGYSELRCCELANQVAAKVVSFEGSKLEADYIEIGEI